MRRMPAGQWVAFEGYNTVHDCDSPVQPSLVSDSFSIHRSPSKPNEAGIEDRNNLDFLDVDLTDQQLSQLTQNGKPGAKQRQLPTSTQKDISRAHRRKNPIITPTRSSQSARILSKQPSGDAKADSIGRLSARKPAISNSSRAVKFQRLGLIVGLIVLSILALYWYRSSSGTFTRSERANSSLRQPSVSLPTNETQNSNGDPLSSLDSIDREAKDSFEQGVALAKEGRYAEAVEAYRHTLSLKTDYAEAHHELGYALYKLKRYKESVESSQKALTLNSTNSDTYNNLALAYSAIANWSEAAKAFQRAIDLKAENPQAYFGLGFASKNLNDEESAIAAFKQAVRLRQTYAAAHYELGLCYVRIGDQNLALEEYEILSGMNEKLAAKLYEAISEMP